MATRSRIADDRVTVSEFHRLVPDGMKADLLDGVIHMASPDTNEADELTNFIHYLLRGYDRAKRLGGQVKGSRFAFRISKHRAPEPDVAYIVADRVHLIGQREMNGGPDVAVEVVSRESRSRDYGTKKLTYQRAGVSEYWIIDPLHDRVEFHRLQSKRYFLVPLQANHIFRSEVVPGFWLDVNWLLAWPLPNDHECLQRVLAQ